MFLTKRIFRENHKNNIILLKLTTAPTLFIYEYLYFKRDAMKIDSNYENIIKMLKGELKIAFQ